MTRTDDLASFLPEPAPAARDVAREAAAALSALVAVLTPMRDTFSVGFECGTGRDPIILDGVHPLTGHQAMQVVPAVERLRAAAEAAWTGSGAFLPILGVQGMSHDVEPGSVMVSVYLEGEIRNLKRGQGIEPALLALASLAKAGMPARDAQRVGGIWTATWTFGRNGGMQITTEAADPLSAARILLGIMVREAVVLRGVRPRLCSFTRRGIPPERDVGDVGARLRLRELASTGDPVDAFLARITLPPLARP